MECLLSEHVRLRAENSNVQFTAAADCFETWLHPLYPIYKVENSIRLQRKTFAKLFANWPRFMETIDDGYLCVHLCSRVRDEHEEEISATVGDFNSDGRTRRGLRLMHYNDLPHLFNGVVLLGKSEMQALDKILPDVASSLISSDGQSSDDNSDEEEEDYQCDPNFRLSKDFEIFASMHGLQLSSERHEEYQHPLYHPERQEHPNTTRKRSVGTKISLFEPSEIRNLVECWNSLMKVWDEGGEASLSITPNVELAVGEFTIGCKKQRGARFLESYDDDKGWGPDNGIIILNSIEVCALRRMMPEIIRVQRERSFWLS